MCCTNSCCLLSHSCDVQGAVAPRAPQWTSESSLQDGEDVRLAIPEERAERTPQGWGVIAPEPEGGWDKGQQQCRERGYPSQRRRRWADAPRWPPQVYTARCWGLALHEYTWKWSPPHPLPPATRTKTKDQTPELHLSPYSRLPTLTFSSFLCQSPASLSYCLLYCTAHSPVTRFQCWLSIIIQNHGFPLSWAINSVTTAKLLPKVH